MEIDDNGNEIIKRGPGRPPGKQSKTKRVDVTGKSGPVRKKTDINSVEMANVFKSLKKVSTNPNPFSIAELICNVVTADLKNQIPGDVVARTQKSIEILNDISEDMIYTGGGVGIDDNLPGSLDSLDSTEVKQIESKDVADKIRDGLPEEEINLREEEEIINGNEEGKITEEVGII